MINHFLNMTFIEKLSVIAGAVLACAALFAMSFLASVLCILTGHGANICGM